MAKTRRRMGPLHKLSSTEATATRAEGASAQSSFKTTLADLESLVRESDGVEVMARLAFSLLYSLGRDPQRQKRQTVQVFHLELLQALYLSKPRTATDADADHAAMAGRAMTLIADHATAFLDRSSGRIADDPTEDARLALVDQVQRWSLAVRGARHIHQTLGFLKDVAPSLDVAFRRKFGCSLDEVVKLIEGFFDLLSQRFNADRDWRRKWMWERGSRAYKVDAFCARLPEYAAERFRAEAARPGLSHQHLFGLMWVASERLLAGIFTFRYEDIDASFRTGEETALRAFLDRLSYSFGDLAQVSADRIQLANPVRLRPLVRLDDDSYFAANSASLGTGLVEVIEDLCADDAKLKERWERAKGDWLEIKLKQVVKAGLPHADVWSKAKWVDDEGKEWESDVVAVIDKTVLVFEAKSGRLSAPARRGAPERLKSDLKKLVVDGSEQSERFRDRVAKARGPVTFTTADGPLILDPQAVRRITRVTVVFDSLGSLSAHWPQLVEAGLLPSTIDIAPTMSVFELETVFEVLTLELERCHYLHRRSDFEKNARYTADELDLLAFYLDTQFNVGEAEFDGTPFELYGASIPLAAGYSERRAAGTLVFPIKRSNLWSRLLNALEDARPVGWTRFGYRLLCADLKGQKTFESLVRQGWRAVERKPNHFFTTGITFGSRNHRHTIAFAIGAPNSPQQFQQNIGHASRSAGLQGGQDNLLLLYWFFPKTGHAYDFIGVMRTAGQIEASARRT